MEGHFKQSSDFYFQSKTDGALAENLIAETRQFVKQFD